MTTDPYTSRLPSADTRAEATVFPRALRDRFELVRELRYGRLGTVYEAVDRTRPLDAADRRVALLRIPFLAGRSPERIERDFARLLSLRHPNIVRVFELVRVADAYIVTMEFIDAEPLCVVLDSLSPELPSRDEAFDVIRAVGGALEYAHARGAVHGDVDVANVLVGGGREVRVPFAPSCLLRRAPLVARACDDTRGLARIAYALLAGVSPSGGPAGRGDRKPRRIRGLGRAKLRPLRAALCVRDDRGPDMGELVTAFAAPAEVRAFRVEARRVAWAAVMIITIAGLGYALRQDRPLPAEPIVDAQVLPLDPEDTIDDEPTIDDEKPAIDHRDPELQPVSG